MVLARSADPHVDGVVRRLYLDVATAEVVHTLRERGIRAVLLKGLVTARWLYPDGGRTYGDIDLLVSPAQFAEAELVLEELGFSHALGAARPDEPVPYEHDWRRGPPQTAAVDLHRSLCWATGEYSEVWQALTEETELVDVAGTQVEALGLPARVLLVAAHAAQHGQAGGSPLEDLRRALARTEFPSWEQAKELAGRVGAVDFLAAGLRLAPEGARIADDLELPETVSIEAQLRAEGAPRIALGLLRLAQTPSLRAGLRLFAGELVPSRAFMETWHPLAGRGRVGLLLAHLWRLVSLAAKAPSGVSALLRARRRS